MDLDEGGTAMLPAEWIQGIEETNEDGKMDLPENLYTT
jgi:hypothetical protein